MPTSQELQTIRRRTEVRKKAVEQELRRRELEAIRLKEHADTRLRRAEEKLILEEKRKAEIATQEAYKREQEASRMHGENEKRQTDV